MNDRIDCLAQGAVAVPLHHLGLIHASGADAAGFLNNLLSNDALRLGPDAAQWTSFNTAQGRMLANFLLWRDGGGYSLALSADLAPGLLKKLSFYILRAKVALALPGPERTLIGLAGPAAADCLARAALPVPHSDMRQASAGERRTIRIKEGLFVLDLAAADAPSVFAALHQAGATAGEAANWQLAMIRAGLPLVTAATQEAFIPQMLNFELVGGVSFTKGCYPGQEIVARTQHLGKPKRRMARIAFVAPPGVDVRIGDDLYTPDAEQTAGTLVNFAQTPEGVEALAVIRTHCTDAIHIGSPDGPRAQVLDLPYDVPQ